MLVQPMRAAGTKSMRDALHPVDQLVRHGVEMVVAVIITCRVEGDGNDVGDRLREQRAEEYAGMYMWVTCELGVSWGLGSYGYG